MSRHIYLELQWKYSISCKFCILVIIWENYLPCIILQCNLLLIHSYFCCAHCNFLNSCTTPSWNKNQSTDALIDIHVTNYALLETLVSVLILKFCSQNMHDFLGIRHWLIVFFSNIQYLKMNYIVTWYSFISYTITIV